MIKILILASISFFNPRVSPDSVRMEIVNGKKFVIHQVTAGETLYGISKRYGVTVDQILEVNPNADAGLEIGQMLKVPFVPRPKPKPTEGTMHKVAEKETLFSISRLYGVTIEELKQWNNLTDNNLALGQELTIKKKGVAQPVSAPTEVRASSTVHKVEAKETLFSISRKYGVTPAQLKAWNNLETEELKIGQTLFITQSTNLQQTVQQPVIVQQEPKVQEQRSNENPVVFIPTEKVPTVTITESIRNDDEIVQSGLAELIEGTEGNRKHLALHRTAPVGTILKVRNEMNNREVFVRVMGKLPDTALNDKLIIKLSKSAYDRLGAIDARFRVEVTYSQ
jgi:LysM repeat protein